MAQLDPSPAAAVAPAVGDAPAVGLAALGGRRAELFAAAVAVFAERGYRATSMRELAQAVGLSKSALYHYVRSKEELLVALYEDVLAQRLEEQAAVRSSGLPADEALRRILVDRFVHACANRQLLRVFFEEEAELPSELMATVRERRKLNEDVVVGVIEQGVAEGVFAVPISPRLAARAMAGAVNFVHKWFDPTGPRTAEDLADDFATYLLAGLRP
jgi:TetR/AcrR family transcriptional regulator